MIHRRWLVVLLTALALVGGCSSPPPPATPTTPVPTPAPSTEERVPPSPTSAGTPEPSVDSHAPPGWVSVSSVDPTILLDIRYATPHNFVGRPIAGYLQPLCVLPNKTAQALHQVQLAAIAQGFLLKMYDCYRPARAGADFVAWRDTPDEATQAEFYPTLTKSQLFSLGFVGGAATSHSSGSAVDLTLVAAPGAVQRAYVPGEPLAPCTAPQAQRFPDNSIDMGTGFDCFDPLSHTLNPQITGAAHDNRLRLKQLMTDGGFVNYVNEWWHYDLIDPPYPNQFFDFPVALAALS
jgi:D-alanyl-D-alanine dipeptidase